MSILDFLFLWLLLCLCLGECVLNILEACKTTNREAKTEIFTLRVGMVRVFHLKLNISFLFVQNMFP